MIISFKHKGLEQLYLTGTAKGVQAKHIPKLLRIILALDYAQSVNDINVEEFRLHSLKGNLSGYFSIWVNGNWRVTFRFVDTDVELVDYTDYH
jgi:proteic killer suppression protein